MCSVLAILNNLSRTFQAGSVNYARIQPAIDACRLLKIGSTLSSIYREPMCFALVNFLNSPLQAGSVLLSCLKVCRTDGKSLTTASTALPKGQPSGLAGFFQATSYFFFACCHLFATF